MFQVTASVWNLVAEHRPKTALFAALMAMTHEQMDKATDQVLSQLKAAEPDGSIRLAWLVTAPLWMENEAISRAVQAGEVARSVLPEVISAQEAAEMGAQEYRLNLSEKNRLKALLMAPLPTLKT